ncbi:Proteasome assembly chaperone (PAC2) family protein [Candidatus Methanophagaceae archaeon]|nr:Proteasome assembly chaperone (PAC2) family protein [Methanophagales archaeon]
MLSQKPPFRIHKKPELLSSSLVVGWSEDAGKLGSKVIDYLCKKLKCTEFAEIEPADFFPLAGVSVEDDVAQFPESKFYYCQQKNLVILKSSSPRYEWYRFLDSVLDVAEHYCHTTELYTIGGMVSPSAHTAPRDLFAIANSMEMKDVLSQYDLARDFDYETPTGQRPTISSYLLWLAKKRNMAASSLWVPVPFYLVSTEDPRACRKTVEFLDRRFGLGIDLAELDDEVAVQSQKIAQVRVSFPEIDNYIQRLESSLGLAHEENETLLKEIEGFLRKKD